MRHFKLPLLVISLLILCTFHGRPRAGPEPPKRARTVDVYTVSDSVFVPGSKAALRIATRGVTSMTRSFPLRGARVTVSLAGKGKTKQLFNGRSNALGAVDAKFQLPNWPAGSYNMTVKVASRSGTKKVVRSVQLKRAGRVLLVTDKPIYQPRQTINMRALALASHDLRPLSQETVRFEVMDPKGNKVFKHEAKTNAYGIVATTFSLADEIAMGNYQIEAAPVRKGVAEAASKTVVVKKYVLPKFKVAVKTDKTYYLPRQTVKGTIQSDYFFGKPVSGGKVEVKASTFDGVSFKEFSKVRGRTGKDGAWKFSVQLPGYFVGQPLLKGNALVRLAVKVVDTANHPEKGTRSVPVAATPIRVTAIPESGRLVPDVKNRIFVVATYPDGSPAQANISVKNQKKKVIAKLRTDAAGVGALFTTPREKKMRQGSYRSRMRAGRRAGYYYTRLMDLTFEAQDDRGNKATVRKSFSTDPEKDRVLLRTDKAIYKGGDLLRANVLTTGGGADTLYMDLVKNRQTLLTRAVRLRGGKGALTLPLGSDVFGSVELHAYRIKSDGEIQRDARVLYIQPANELKIEVAPDKKVYRPGGKAVIRFRVTGKDGRPRPSALGVIVVDEAVYALQELKPGLEKVYFTLEKELSKPKYQIEFAPADSLPAMIKVHHLQQRRQRIAKVLLAKAKPVGKPGLWENPVTARMQKAQQDFYQLRSAIQRGVYQFHLAYRTDKGKWAYRHNLVRKLIQKNYLNKRHAKDPFGVRYTVRTIEQLWPELRARNLLPAVELQRLWQIHWRVRNEVNSRTKYLTKLKGRGLHSHLAAAYAKVRRDNRELCKDPAGRVYRWGRLAYLPGFRVRDLVANVHNNRISSVFYALRRLGRDRVRNQTPRALDKRRNAYVLPYNSVRLAVRKKMLSVRYAKDAFGRYFRLRKRATERKQHYVDRRLRFYDVYSVGADGKAGTRDDLRYPLKTQHNEYQLLTKALGVKPGTQTRHRGRGFGRGWGRRPRPRMLRAPRRARARAPMAEAAAGGMADAMAPMKKEARPVTKSADGPAAPKKRQVRVRSYFPETLLFKPALITDDQGRAELKLAMADSITTWRMTASANSADGSLGSVSRGVKVFQDFFADLDLPVALTQNDEVSIPVVVYNYLKKPQRVRLELRKQSWFELLGGGKVQELTIKPAEVAATYYRIRVKKLGRRTLQVQADGSAMSDAIRREIEVLPDGQEKNLVGNGRLKGTVTKTIRIPERSVPGASKILVRLYPGVFSQVIEGMESMLRLPGG